MTDKKLDYLRAELMAIAVWDCKYQKEKDHSDLEKAAYRARRNRRREIVTQIGEFALGEKERGLAASEKDVHSEVVL